MLINEIDTDDNRRRYSKLRHVKKRNYVFIIINEIALMTNTRRQ